MSLLVTYLYLNSSVAQNCKLGHDCQRVRSQCRTTQLDFAVGKFVQTRRDCRQLRIVYTAPTSAVCIGHYSITHDSRTGGTKHISALTVFHIVSKTISTSAFSAIGFLDVRPFNFRPFHFRPVQRLPFGQLVYVGMMN